jgi:hypothetical protein
MLKTTTKLPTHTVKHNPILAAYTFEIILSYSLNANRLQTCNNMDKLKFKNKKCIKYEKDQLSRYQK